MKPTCQKCGTGLFPSGYCEDETCPFSDVLQDGSAPRVEIMSTIQTDDDRFTATIDVFEVFEQHRRNKTLKTFIQQLDDENYAIGTAGDSILYDMLNLGTSIVKRDLDELLSYCEATQRSDSPVGFSVSLQKEDIANYTRYLHLSGVDRGE